MLSRVFPHASIGRGRDQLSAEKSRKRCVLARPFALDGKLLGCFLSDLDLGVGSLRPTGSMNAKWGSAIITGGCVVHIIFYHALCTKSDLCALHTWHSLSESETS